ncbi:PLDc N-terminal domain-containing protein [Proteinivorax hydrogeniformans]|uniref:PLDc N-terminal domain-containing protein n=1 Tax=Proteinivorax hydrogeniformans TaxID=1826727 RepID=A0AAU8HR18_9FIRM
MGELSILQIFLLALPFLLIELVLRIYCVIKLVKEGSRNLNQIAWLCIILLVNFGWAAFLLVGKRRY